MNKQKKKKKDELWAYARKKYRLNAGHIAMAKEIGMNPKKFGSMAPNPSEQWKGPLGEFIEECYNKRFKKKKENNM